MRDWKDKFEENQEGLIVLNTYQQVEDLIDLLDERYTRSDVTNQEYDTDVKRQCIICLLFQRHFRTFCHDQMYLYYFFILLQLFQQFYCKGCSRSPTHTDDKSLSHFSSFPDFSVHIKVCLKNFPTICTNYTRSFPISFAILLFTWIIPTKNT